MESNRSAEESPRKGNVPVAISYRTAPKENRSVRASRSLPRACSGDISRAGEMVGLDRCLRGSKRTGCSGCYLGQAEIENLGMSALGHKNVSRLDVPVNDILGMGGVERVGDLDCQREQGLGFERMAANHVLQRRAI